MAIYKNDEKPAVKYVSVPPAQHATHNDESLKPCDCPFCGYNVINSHSRTAKSAAGGKHYFVRCPMCHTEGPRSLSSEADAIAKWNRAQPDAAAIRNALDFAASLDRANRNGVCPPQNWTSTASEHIRRLARLQSTTPAEPVTGE